VTRLPACAAGVGVGLAALAGTVPALAEDVAVFLFCGQSNMVGFLGEDQLVFDDFDYAQPQDAIWEEYEIERVDRPGGWGPLAPHGGAVPMTSYGSELSFGRLVDLSGAHERVAILKVAVGGTSLGGWWVPSNNALYPEMLAKAVESLGALAAAGHTVRVEGFGWVQGYSDNWDDTWAANYQLNLDELVTRARQDLTAAGFDALDMHALVTQSPIEWAQSGIPVNNLTAIRAGKAAWVAADGNATLIDTDGLAFRDAFIHWDGTSRLEIGRRMARAWIARVLPCIADLTGDGMVDSGDLGEFVTRFVASDARADLTGDGQVDSGDLAAFITAFLAGCSPA
jgi:hypothetical protein